MTVHHVDGHWFMLKAVPPVQSVATRNVVKMDEDGKFVKGAFVPNHLSGIPERRKQLIEIEHSLTPYKASIKLNGQSIRCRRYEIRQAAREFGTILLELPLTDYTVKSDSGIMYVEIDGMRFKRVE